MTIGRFGAPEKSRKLLAPGDECPMCGKAMRQRSRKSDGKSFLGCSGFPDCRHVESEFRDAPAGYKAPEQKPYNPQAVADYKARNSSNQDFTEFELKLMLDLVQDAVETNKDDIKFGIIVKLEKILTERFRANRSPIKEAMDDASIPYTHVKEDEEAPQEF